MRHICIKSEQEALTELRANPKKWNVISIRCHDELPLKEIDSLALNVLHMSFDDVWLPQHEHMGYVLPSASQIARIFEWAANQKSNIPLMVHCKAGCSRSSAVAFLLVCQEKNLEAALELLDPDIHYPNERIINLGSHQLRNVEIVNVILEFYRVAERRQRELGYRR